LIYQYKNNSNYLKVSQTMVLEINQLTGGYSKEPVIHDISFNIKSGEIIGLIGLNGAGKSTTIKHILGLLRPHSGSIKVMDTAIETDVEDYRRHIGLTPEEVESRKGPLLKRFRLEDKEDTFPSHFSKGMKQKVMLICAFIVEPDLYIIDEPFLGLGPLGIESLIELMISERDKNRSILMSTHILATAERYCDRYIIIDQGRKIADG